MGESPDSIERALGPLLSGLSGANRAYIEDLYADWLDSPSSVDAQWRSVFESFGDRSVSREDVVGPGPIRRSIFGGKAAAQVANQAEQTRKSAAVLQLISAYRRNGHLAADLDPLDLRKVQPHPELSLDYWGLSESDLDSTFHTGRLAGPQYATLREIVERCKKTYCGTVGSEFMYIRDEERRRWVERNIEESGSRIPLTRETALRVLEKLTAADRLEQFIHTKYLGAKRFSVEGGEAVIPLLDQLLSRLTGLGAKEAVIGMAHRGRLNVLANILGKAHSDIFEEFEDAFERPENLGSGDVKYHLGFAHDVETPSGRIHVNLAFNPSHLEFVAPVVEGQVRARQDHFGDRSGREAVPVIIHGDAAFAGQGIVTETLQLAGLDGYSTGGTIHIVLNNQIGFTTPPESSRSAEHCTDVVKLILPPVLHVNSDDLGAVAFVARLAAEYRQKYGKDIVIDLWCYRKYGHNEGDEPAFTNPVMVKAIKSRPTPVELFQRRALELGVLTQNDIDEANRAIREHLDAELARARERSNASQKIGFGGLWKGLQGGYAPSAADRPTRVSAEELKRLALKLTEVPAGFSPHRKLKRIFARRRALAAGDETTLDWALGETLAFASLVEERYDVRISGQDAGRGTFSHRHAVLHDQKTGKTHVQLANLSEKQGSFEVIDSPLSEAAVLGFEYGYTLVRPNSLVIWEAQFGDFANGAQVIIDQFVCSSEAKWNRCSGLVMMLPHGYEGQGPEHSSARLERFLNLSGDDNWRVMNLTTPAQLFHALRSQLHRNYRKPLILMTPKSLLRHPRAVSELSEFCEGGFFPVLDDAGVGADARRVVMCSGKVFYDLEAERAERGRDDIALVRVEQLYPFPEMSLREIVDARPNAEEFVWCQEEPANMGAWGYIQPLLRDLLGDRTLRYAGRPRSAAPATGSKHLHLEEQAALIQDALRPSAPEAVKTA